MLALSNKKSKFFLLKDSFEEGSASFKVFRIEEEIDAWNRAKVLAKRLNIPIEDDKWEEMFSAAILKYIKWAAK